MPGHVNQEAGPEVMAGAVGGHKVEVGAANLSRPAAQAQAQDLAERDAGAAVESAGNGVPYWLRRPHRKPRMGMIFL